MICKRCGCEFDKQQYRRMDNSVQCPNCGTVYRKKTQNASQPRQDVFPARPPADDRYVYAQQNRKTSFFAKKLWKLPIWAWGIILVMILVVAGSDNTSKEAAIQPASVPSGSVSSDSAPSGSVSSDNVLSDNVSSGSTPSGSVSSDNVSSGSAPSDSVPVQAVANASAATSPKEASVSLDLSADFGSSRIEVVRATIRTVGSQKYVICEYNWTNNSDSIAMFLSKISERAFQNGVALETGFLLDVDSDTITQVLPGYSLTVRSIHKLSDPSTEIVFYVEPLLGQMDSNTPLTFTINPA